MSKTDMVVTGLFIEKIAGYKPEAKEKILKILQHEIIVKELNLKAFTLDELKHVFKWLAHDLKSPP